MEIFRNENEPANFRVMAGREILDRGYCKPARAYNHAVGTYDFSKLTDEQLRTTYELLKLASPDSIGDTD